MYKISLVHMPFASLEMPSLALTQLKARLDDQFGSQVSVRILYLNQNFGHRFGTEMYLQIAESLDANMSGLGNWLFRQAAFPDSQDNSKEYFNRFFYTPGTYFPANKAVLLEKRASVDTALSRIIDTYRLDGASRLGL